VKRNGSFWALLTVVGGVILSISPFLPWMRTVDRVVVHIRRWTNIGGDVSRPWMWLLVLLGAAVVAIRLGRAIEGGRESTRSALAALVMGMAAVPLVALAWGISHAHHAPLPNVQTVRWVEWGYWVAVAGLGIIVISSCGALNRSARERALSTRPGAIPSQA